MASSSTPPISVKAAYWPSWLSNISAIDTSLFTHIFYAFLKPSEETPFQLQITDATTAALKNLHAILHRAHPPVKALISIGGANCDPSILGRMASDVRTRKAFISSCIQVARKFGFDGMDLNWQFPKNKREMEDFGILLAEWRSAIVEEARSSTTTNQSPLLLTAAVYYKVGFTWGIHREFPVVYIKNSLDWIHVMSYEYHGSWDTSKTGAHAALRDPNGDGNLSTSYGINSWIKAGVPANKVVMGLPLYGKTWKLKDPNSHEIGAAAVGVGPGADGVMSFCEVEKFNRDNRSKVVHDQITASVYSFSGSTWIGYEDEETTAKKIKFAKDLGLRGYFFWALGYDSNWKISKRASKEWSR